MRLWGPLLYPGEGEVEEVLVTQWVKELLTELKKMEFRLTDATEKAREYGDSQATQDTKLWNIGDKMMYLRLTPKDHVLESKCVGPFLIMNKISPTVVQINKEKRGKGVHTSQLKLWPKD